MRHRLGLLNPEAFQEQAETAALATVQELVQTGLRALQAQQVHTEKVEPVVEPAVVVEVVALLVEQAERVEQVARALMGAL